MLLRKNEIEHLVRLAGTAPSGGNVQPWKVVAHASALEMYVHPTRGSGLLDVGHYASIFSLGSFLENLSLASAQLGLAHEVKIHPFEGLLKPVVTVSYWERQSPPAAEDPLYAAILQRHTNRRPHTGEPLPEARIQDLRASIRELPFVGLSAFSERARKQRAASILGKTDALRMRHSSLFPEMMSELRWDAEEARRSADGIALSTLELPAGAVSFLRALRRYPRLRYLVPRPLFEKMSAPLVMGCSHLCSLVVRGDLSTEKLVLAGRASQRIWLAACSLGLAVQPMTVLPFLLIRAREFGGEGLSLATKHRVLLLGKALQELFAVEQNEFPLFVFRLSRASAASDRSLRLPPATLYELAEAPQ